MPTIQTQIENQITPLSVIITPSGPPNRAYFWGWGNCDIGSGRSFCADDYDEGEGVNTDYGEQQAGRDLMGPVAQIMDLFLTF